MGLGAETIASKIITRGLAITDRWLNAAISVLHREQNRMGRRLGSERLR
jgi:hypothetical protein